MKLNLTGHTDNGTWYFCWMASISFTIVSFAASVKRNNTKSQQVSYRLVPQHQTEAIHKASENSKWSFNLQVYKISVIVSQVF